VDSDETEGVEFRPS